ncbi:MAG: SUMF1/EgtB/PvdO family nonheme iron enzyme [Candidatus Hydrogenedentes bacterium]|nr:SUMF1/EgtB/PvdO family nonheme iron enzyme [Candidatus Hydrogenedentota bacterium]
MACETRGGAPAWKRVLNSLPEATWKGVIEAGKVSIGLKFVLTFLSELQDACRKISSEERLEFISGVRRERLRNIEKHLEGLGVDLERTRMLLAGTIKAVDDLEAFNKGHEVGTHALLNALIDVQTVSRREKRQILLGLRELRGTIESRKEATHEILARLDDLPTLLRGQLRSARDSEQADFERSYLDEIERTYGYLDLLGIPIFEEQDPLPIDAAFVSLAIDEGRGAAGGQAAERMLADHDEMVIIGNAGAGKSTLMQWEAVQCTKGEKLSCESPNPWYGCIPFVLPLRNLNPSEAFPPRNRWVTLSTRNWERAQENHGAWLNRVLDDGRALLILDGLDELAREKRKAFWRELRKCVSDRDIIYRVVSRPIHRPGENDDEWRPPVDASVVTVLPLTPENVDLLIDRWHEATIAAEGNAETRPALRMKLQRYAGELKNKLRQSAFRRIRELSETPLLCAAICLINRHNKQRLPKKRHHFYRDFCEALMQLRDAEKGVRTGTIYDDLDLEDLVRMHAHVAFKMTTSGAGTPSSKGRGYFVEASKENVLIWLKSCINDIKRQAIREQATASDLLIHLLERGLLRTSSKDKIGFYHPALQEYLAATAIPLEGELDFLIRQVEDDRWHDIIVLSAGGFFAGADFGNDLIAKLLDRAESSEVHSKLLRVCHSLAVACLETACAPNAKIRDMALAGLGKIVPPRSYAQAREVAAAGDAVVPLLEYERWKGLRQREKDQILAFCGLTLMLIGSDAATEALGRGYGFDNILDTLVRAPGMNVLELPPVLDVVMDLGTVPEFAREHVRDLQPLENLPRLEALDLADCDKLTNLLPLAHLTCLKSLTLEGCRKVDDLTPLRHLTGLRQLKLAECSNITDLRPLTNLTGLEFLDLSFCKGIKDVSPLHNLSHLRTLKLRCCPALENLSPLENLRDLEELDIAYCESISNFGTLTGLSQVRILIAPGCDATRECGGSIGSGSSRISGSDYVEMGGRVPIKMVWVKGGEFEMGSPDTDRDRYDDEGPIHKVKLEEGFWMGATPVTQEQYESVMGMNPSNFVGAQKPVEGVSWFDANEFCRRLSERSGVTYSLPTEAQWEFACRAGSQCRFSFGSANRCLGSYAWFSENSRNGTHPVGSKRPNASGLYDMHGNVWEWCQDVWHHEYDCSSVDNAARALTSRSYRVTRGGSWGSGPSSCRSAVRGSDLPTYSSCYLGFRVCSSSRTQSAHVPATNPQMSSRYSLESHYFGEQIKLWRIYFAGEEYRQRFDSASHRCFRLMLRSTQVGSGKG